jgi:Tfp pilus assembly protein PilF
MRFFKTRIRAPFRLARLKSLAVNGLIALSLKTICSIAIFCAVLTCAGQLTHATAAPVLGQSGGGAEQAAQLVEEGVAALERGDEAAARSAFERALKAEPDNVAAHTYLGVLADRAGELKEAERHFAAAAIAAPLLPSARNNHGAILLRLGRVEQAAKQFEASLKLKKDQPKALVNLAQIRFASGTQEGLRAALELFERAYGLAPDIDVARALVITSLRLGERAIAEKYYRDYASRLEHEGNATAATPSMRAELGAALLENNLPDEAIKELDAAVTAAPGDAGTIIALARAYLQRKDIRAAGRTLESAVARGLDEAPVYALLADVYEKSGHIENAIPAMRLAIERDPQSEAYRFTYGLLLTNAYAPAAAVIRLEESLKVFPNSSRLWFALGIAHFKWGHSAEAARAFNRAVELDPKFAPAFAYLGLTYVELTQFAEAVKLYEQALAVNPRLGVVHYLAADALVKLTADNARIEAHLVQAVKMEPSFAPAHLALGKLLLRTDRVREAATELEQAIAINPNLAEAYYQLGRVYGRLKRTTEAEAALATFKRISEEQKENTMSERLDISRRLANVLF